MKAPQLRPLGKSLRRSLGAGQWEVSQHRFLLYRTFHHTRNTFEERPKHSFRGQVYESTLERLERERAEDEKYRQIRAAREGQGSRHVALMTFVLATAFGTYYLGTLNPRERLPTSTITLEDTPKHQHKTDASTVQAAWVDFAQIVGKENASTNEDDLKSHAGSSWSSYDTPEHVKPFVVVYPKSTEEVSRIMKVCHRRKIPVTAYSGGTSLEGHFVPEQGGVCIDFSRMDQILALHQEDLDVVVQPAVGWEDLNEYLAKDNLFFPPDPGPGARIGGMVGTGCSGTNAYRYGTMREWVTSLTVVLADGTIIKTRQRPRKSSAGYDLTRLFIGSEGTLGLVTEATLKVTVKPTSTSVAVATFPSLHAAGDCVSKVVGSGIQVAGVELLDSVQMRIINDSGTTSRKWKEAATLFFKFTGTQAGIKEQIGIVQSLAKKSSSKSFEFAKNDDEAAELWSARKEALWSCISAKRSPEDRVWTTDVAVPISKLPDIIQQTRDDVDKTGLLAGMVGHVGDGNFHAIILFSEAEKPLAEELVHNMVVRAVEMEGTVTGEHGVGLVKRDYLPHELGQETVDAMRTIKQAFDPQCLLNCNKIVRMEVPAKGEIKPW